MPGVRWGSSSFPLFLLENAFAGGWQKPTPSSRPCCSVWVTKMLSLVSSHQQHAATAQRCWLCSQGPCTYLDHPGHGHKKETHLNLLRKPLNPTPFSTPRTPPFSLIRLHLFPSKAPASISHPYDMLSTRLIPLQQRPGRIFFHDMTSTEIQRSYNPTPYSPTHIHQWRRTQILEHKSLIEKGERGNTSIMIRKYVSIMMSL